MLTTINNTPLWIETSGEGPAVVAVHGLGGTSTFFDAVVGRLTDTNQVTCFDLEGHGRSPLSGPVSIAGWAGHIGAILDHLGVQSAHVIAHSMGTVIAQEFAAEHPDRVESLVLMGPIRELPDGGRGGLRDRAASVRNGKMGDVAAGVATNGTGPATKADRPEIVGYARESVLRQTDEGYAVACEALADSVDADQSAISCPVQIITGSADGLAPPDKAQHIADGFANAEVHVIEGIGHWTAIEAGVQVADLVTGFIARKSS